MIKTGIIQGIFGFAVYLASVSLIIRMARRAEPALIVVGAAMISPIFSLGILLGAGQRINVWTYATSYCFFALCFLMVFGAIYKSVSLRVLSELSNKPNRADLYARVLERHIAKESYEHRLDTIETKRLAVRTDGGLALTERGRKIAQSARSLQDLFGIAHSG